jgi:DNA-binding CsgD family transcriptional regulator
MDRLSDAQPRKAQQHSAEIETVRALVDACAGRTSAAVARLLAVADAGHNHVAAEISALYEALRLGADPATVAKGLRVRLVGAQHPLGEVFADHADALADEDAAAQLAIAKRFHGLGCDLFAAETATRAADAFAQAGRTSLSREALALATKYAAPCGKVFSWALQLRPQGPQLTSREREIAVLAARGHTNKQIADELVLSVRTVESHLLNACQKLGVENRRKLVDVIDL